MCKSLYILYFSVSMYAAGTDTPSPSQPVTTLRVAEVTQSSVRLDWIPLLGATGYVLRWKEEKGETCKHTWL